MKLTPFLNKKSNGFLVNDKSNVLPNLKKDNMNSISNKMKQILEENIKKGDMIPIIITLNTDIQSFVKGYHA